MRIALLPLPVLVLSCGLFAVGCGSSGGAVHTTPSSSTGGDNSAGGNAGLGGADNLGGTDSSGSGGASVASSKATGGASAAGGAATGGKAGAGGAATGGSKATGGASSVAGAAATGGATAVSTSTSPDPDCNATMPTSGGTSHASSSQGGTNPLAWNVWSNGGNPGTVTIYSTPAFSATWSQSNNYLGRLGLEWGNSGGTYDTHGTITAQFVEKRLAGASSGGSWSYVGIYGWSTNPCIEWYIIDDSFSNMPTNPGSCTNMSNSGITIDGAKYTMCKRNTTGTGGDRCGGASSWNQYYSIRQTARSCGTISITAHFDAWKAAGNSLGNLLEAKILVEVGGGSGTIDFPVAKVTSTK